MSASPTVGVVLPVFDETDFLETAIDSVLTQTFTDFEAVVVAHGATEGVVELLEEYDDPRLSLVELEAAAGVSVGRNRGVRAVEGDLLAFLDHDDVWRPDKLQRHVDPHRRTDAALVYSDVREIDEAGTPIAQSPRPNPAPPGEPLVRQLLLADRVVILTPSSVTLRRSAWAAVGGFDPALRTAEDGDLYLRLAGEHRFERIPLPLVDKRNHDANRSDEYRESYDAHGRLLEKALDRYPFLDRADGRRRRARTAYLRATSALLAGESAEATTYGRESLRYERRLRPLLVVALGLADHLPGPFAPGHRVFTWYHRRFG